MYMYINGCTKCSMHETHVCMNTCIVCCVYPNKTQDLVIYNARNFPFWYFSYIAYLNVATDGLKSTQKLLKS